MAKWSTEQALKKLRAEMRQSEQQRNQEAEQARTAAELRAEFAETASKYKDFATHKDGVIAHMKQHPGLSVENAYRLSTYDGLMKLAVEGQKANSELRKLKAQQTASASVATRPVGTGNAALTTPHSNLPPAEAAFERAKARLSGG
jgi:hypothetical protein